LPSSYKNEILSILEQMIRSKKNRISETEQSRITPYIKYLIAFCEKRYSNKEDLIDFDSYIRSELLFRRNTDIINKNALDIKTYNNICKEVVETLISDLGKDWVQYLHDIMQPSSIKETLITMILIEKRLIKSDFPFNYDDIQQIHPSFLMFINYLNANMKAIYSFAFERKATSRDIIFEKQQELMEIGLSTQELRNERQEKATILIHDILTELEADFGQYYVNFLNLILPPTLCDQQTHVIYNKSEIIKVLDLFDKRRSESDLIIQDSEYATLFVPFEVFVYFCQDPINRSILFNRLEFNQSITKLNDQVIDMAKETKEITDDEIKEIINRFLLENPNQKSAIILNEVKQFVKDQYGYEPQITECQVRAFRAWITMRGEDVVKSSKNNTEDNLKSSEVVLENIKSSDDCAEDVGFNPT
jgi:hypothetical protein